MRMIIKCMKIKVLAPITATLFGVIPNSDNRNIIAERAIELITKVRMTRKILIISMIFDDE